MTTPERDRELRQWAASPVGYRCPDERFEVRRASEVDFDEIHDLVDEAFGVRRPRAVYDWLYRDNPMGKARSVVFVERATDRIISATSRFPWPVARGSEILSGYVSGDHAVAPEWQRHGLYRYCMDIWALPEPERTVVFWWPNHASRAAKRKHGSESSSTSMTRRVSVLRARRWMERRGWSRPLARVAGRLVQASRGARRRITLRAGAVQVVELGLFDEEVANLAQRPLQWPGFWCPRTADFLQWRYLRHPTFHHLAFAAVRDDRRLGYCVVHLDDVTARLMELVSVEPGAARALLAHAITVAQRAACDRMEVVAAPHWQHWELLRSAGFRTARSTFFLDATMAGGDSSVADLENWHCCAGDLV